MHKLCILATLNTLLIYEPEKLINKDMNCCVEVHLRTATALLIRDGLLVQWLQLLLQQGPVYEVKVPISDGYSTI